MKVGLSAVKALIGLGIIVSTVACGENNGLGPTGPSALSGDVSAQSAMTGWSGHDESRVPPIRIPAGVTCPGDAPNVIAMITGYKLEIEWSFIPMVTGYEVVIERLNAVNVWETAKVGTTGATRYEWSGAGDSRYRVRVRSLRCGGTGMWSGYVYVSVDGPKDPGTIPAPTPEEPDCETIYAAGHTSRTQVSMPCNEEPDCELSDDDFFYPSSESETSTNCEDEEQPDCEQISDYSSRGANRTMMTPPCGFSWGDERVRQRTRR